MTLIIVKSEARIRKLDTASQMALSKINHGKIYDLTQLAAW